MSALRERTALGTLAALALVAGCIPGHLALSVRSPSGTNHGRPLYMVVRKVDAKQYATQTYADVASKVVAPDASVLQTEVIYPGTLQRIQLKVPADSPVAISFLFTNPDGAWQVLVPKPTPSIDIELADGRVQTDSLSDEALPPKLPEVEAPKLPGAPEK